MKTIALFRIAISATAALLLTSIAHAALPVGHVTFNDSLNITNSFFPFQVSGMKVFTGVNDGTAITVINVFGPETRTFTVSGAVIDTRVLHSFTFEKGILIRATRDFFAQSDDGTVFNFGTLVDIFDENGNVVGHDRSWLVNGPVQTGITVPDLINIGLPVNDRTVNNLMINGLSVNDPVDTAFANAPTLFMPANPETGDVFKPKDLFPVVDRTAEVVDGSLDVIVPAGTFERSIDVKETSGIDGSVVHRFFAPDVGVVKAEGKNQLLRLTGSTLIQP